MSQSHPEFDLHQLNLAVMKVWQSFIDHPWIKVFGATMATLFSSDLVLIFGVVMLWTLDLLIGLFAAKYKRKEEFSWVKLQFMVVKVFLHGGFLIVIIILSNMLRLDMLQRWGFAFIAIIQFIGISANVFGKEVAAQLADKLKDMIGMDIPLPEKDNDQEQP